MDERTGTKAKTPSRKFFLLAAVAAGILASPAISYLWTNHKSHIVAILPFLILLLCPILHFFHRGKHSKDH
jgi:hypothetical protein